MKRTFIKEGLKWFCILVIIHIAAMILFGITISSTVISEAQMNPAIAVRLIIMFDLIVFIIFALIIAKIESSYVEYRKTLKEKLREPDFSLIKHWKNEYFKFYLVKMCVFIGFQIPFMIFYSAFGFAVGASAVFDQFYVLEAGFYVISGSPLIGLLLDTIAFGAIYFIISLFFMFIAKNSVKKEMVDR